MARFSNALFAFSAWKLSADPSEALLESVSVEPAPVGLTFAEVDKSHTVTASAYHFVILDL